MTTSIRPSPALWLLPVLAALSAGCGWVSFGRKISDEEARLRHEVKLFYTDVQRTFASGNPDAFAALFSPSIARPMTMADIRRWATEFFEKHGRAHMKVRRLEIESIGPAEAVVRLEYYVDTPDGKSGFGGAERDVLLRKRGRWFIASWERLPPEPTRR